MNRLFLIFILSILVGCKSHQTKAPIKPLSGISEFKVAFFFLPQSIQNEQRILKEVFSSFEKIGSISISDKNVLNTQDSLPVLVFSIEEDEKSGSIRIYAETEILVNHCRTGSEIWRKDFYDTEGSSVPVFLEDGTVGFRKVEKSEEEKNLSFPARMIREFDQEYKKSNSKRPVFHIHPNFLKELFQGTT